MDQMFQQPEKSSEQLPAPIMPGGEALPNLAQKEKQPASPEAAEKQIGAAGAAVQQAYGQDDAAAQAATSAILGDDVTTTDPQTPASSQTNIDVIEKEWVEKAKDIVARTKDNPREQSIELSGMKRDYVAKRFGKVLPDNRAA